MTKENGKGVFDIPIKIVKTKKELEEILNPKKDPSQKPKNTRDPNLEDFTFIPGLNLYVANYASMFGKSWYECKQELEEKGSRMLTPAEFWTYYNYCTKDKPGMLKDSLKHSGVEEWLNVFVKNKEEIIINPDLSGHGNISNHYSPPQGYGEFDTSDMSPYSNSGLPTSIKSKGEFGYKGPLSKLAALRKCCTAADQIVFCLENSPDFKNAYTCVREVKTR